MPARRAPLPTSAWQLLLASALVAVAVGLLVGALGPVLPSMHTHLHTPLAQLGVIFGANFAGALLATLGVGPLLDRYAARPLLMAGVAVMLLGLLLLPLATNLLEALAALL